MSRNISRFNHIFEGNILYTEAYTEDNGSEERLFVLERACFAGSVEQVKREQEEVAWKHLQPVEDSVNHPKHYTSHPSGVECITITEHMTFNAGNAMKYLWRAGLKCGASAPGSHPNEGQIEDLRKAAWYVAREIERLLKEGDSGSN